MSPHGFAVDIFDSLLNFPGSRSHLSWSPGPHRPPMRAGVAAEQILEAAVQIDGGWHIKDLGDGRCVDVMKMLYNYRVVTSCPGHQWNEHGWCYFGHGVDSTGAPRTMATAKAAAFLAAAAWDGVGDPPGHNKQAF